MMRNGMRSLRRNRRGVVAIEFAILGVVLFMVTLGGMDLGLILWTQGALQMVASDAARCGAIGATGCTSSSGIESYVQTQAANWIMGSVAAGLTVNVNSAVSSTSCPAISLGKYETVEVKTSYFSGFLPPPFSKYTIDVCASYAT